MAKNRASKILPPAQPFFPSCGLRRKRWLADRRQPVNRAMFSPGDLIVGHVRKAAAQMLGLLTAALLSGGSPSGRAEGGSQWRIYPVTAGPGGTFAVAVTVSPRGN